MEKRVDNSREGTAQKSNCANSNNTRHNHNKRNKKRGNKKGGSINGPAQGGSVSGGVECQQHLNSKKNYLPPATAPPQPEYGNVFWQQPQIQQQQLLAAQNGQRLFTAVSDPTVCGYSPMPLTYAMEPVSLPPMYQLYQQVPRPSYRNYNRGRARRNYSQNQSHQGGKPSTTNFLNSQINGYSSLQENNFHYSTNIGHQNGDYASLPPAANIDNGGTSEELNSEHRRYSDPGLGPPQIQVHSRNDDSDSIESGSSVTTVGRSSKLISSLIEQVTALKESNSQLFKELHQTKSELEMVKFELDGLKRSNFADYQPGMLSDIVREMREAAKIREESLISKVKSMMSEKQSKPIIDNQDNAELDELKKQLARITDEKSETETRLVKVEQELATIKSNANHEGQEIVALEEETLALRRELQEARASRTIAENHAAKLEKLMGGILRKKMKNGEQIDEEDVDSRGLIQGGEQLSSDLTKALLLPCSSSTTSSTKMTVNNETIHFKSNDDIRSRNTSDSINDDTELRLINLNHSSAGTSPSGNNPFNSEFGTNNSSFRNLSSSNGSGLSGPVTDL